MSSSLPPPNAATAFHRTAIALHARKKFEQAADLFKKATERYPGFVDAWYNLGLTFKKLNIPAQATLAFETALSLRPDHHAARFHLGCLYAQTHRLSDATSEFLTLIEQWPSHPETIINLAGCLLRQNKIEKAQYYYNEALKLTPDEPQVLFNLGVIHAQNGAADTAIQHYQKTIQAAPDYFDAHYNMALLFLAKQQPAFAMQCLEAAKRIDPTHASVNYLIQSLKNNPHLKSAPKDYITALFNGYADHYEPHLLTSLDYVIPELFFDAVSKIKRDPTPLAILDIGCGTGLCGLPFRAMASTLTGVDLSENMLTKAREKNCYDELIQADLLTYLADSQTEFDLILAGDVLVYLGCLDELFKHAHRILLPSGLFVFNTEISEQKDYQIRSSGRFGHTEAYLSRLATRHAFSLISIRQISSRRQHDAPVSGFLCIAKRID